MENKITDKTKPENGRACGQSTAPCYVHSNACGCAFVFVFKREGEYRCLNMRDAKLDMALINKGWKHVATIGADIWLELFLNKNKIERYEQIFCLDT